MQMIHLMNDVYIIPAFLGEGDAAYYLGVSASKLRTLDIPRKALGRRRLYDRRDLDTFRDTLPYEGEDEAIESCDAAFGA